MMIDTDLLAAAMEAEERLIEAEHNTEVARAEFHRAVRRLHLSGGSLREIAEVLGLSHQRVLREWNDDGEARTCSFCGHSECKARRLVGGRGVFICEHCLKLAADVLSTDSKAETSLGVLAVVNDENTRERCSFCGKRRAEVSRLASTGDVAICSECIQFCDEIVAEQLAR